MPEYQLIEKNKNIAKRNFFDVACFRSGLFYKIFKISPPARPQQANKKDNIIICESVVMMTPHYISHRDGISL